jgi:hypothetical protein
MSPMKSGLVLALALAVSGGGFLASAQQGPGSRGLGLYGVGPRLGENVTFALELQAELGLSAEQVRALQTVQEGIQRDVVPLDAEIENIRAGILAGSMNSVDGLAMLRELSAEYQVVANPYRAQVAAILTPEQHQMLQGVMWETRPWGGRGLGSGAVVGAAGVPGVGTGVAWGGAVGVAPVAGLGLGRGAGLGLGRGVGLGVGRAAGLGLGRGAGRGLGRGLGRGAGLCWWWR